MTCEKHTTRYIHTSRETTHIYTNNEINVQNETTMEWLRAVAGIFLPRDGHMEGGGLANYLKASTISKYEHMSQGFPHYLVISFFYKLLIMPNRVLWHMGYPLHPRQE